MSVGTKRGKIVCMCDRAKITQGGNKPAYRNLKAHWYVK